MKNFSGEFGSITSNVTFVGRPQDNTGMAEVSIMFTRMFNSYIPMRWLYVNDFSTARKVEKLLNAGETVIFAEMPWHNQTLQKVLINSKKGNRIGVLLWDSSEIPDKFIRVIESFDKIISPTAFISDVVKKSLPDIDIVTLPLALDTRRFNLSSEMRSISSTKKVKRFGVIASRHPRKNLDLIIEAAQELWLAEFEFELVIQAFLNQGSKISDKFGKVSLAHKQKFLQIIEDPLSNSDYVALIESLDLFISASSGEGFNIPARQALSNGLPILISDIPGHAELKQLPGVSLIPSKGLLPAVYPEFGNKIFGNQFLITKEDIKSSLIKAINEPSLNPNLISKASICWDYRNLEHAYRRQLFENPSNTSRVRRNSKDLVVVAHDAGFFAIFNTFISIQNSWTGDHGFARIYPDWRVASMQKFWKTNEFTSFCYGQSQDGNLYFKLFDSADQFDKSPAEIDQLLDQGLKGHSFNASADPNLTFINADKLYRSAGFPSWRQSMHSRLNGLKPNISVRSRLEETFRELPTDSYLIGMHVRHPSHAMEQPDSTIALASDYIKIAEELMKKELKRNPGRSVHIFLATDQESVISEFSSAFGNLLITIAGVSRVSESESTLYSVVPESKKLKEGFQIQHLNAKNNNNWSLRLAEDVIADAWGLAKCDVLVHTVSNVATAVLFINPNMQSIPIYPDMTLNDIENLQNLRNSTQII